VTGSVGEMCTKVIAKKWLRNKLFTYSYS